MNTYDSWLAKMRKRAQPSGTLSQWAEILSSKHEGSAKLWRDHLQAVFDGEEQASLDLILDLDLISAPAKKDSSSHNQKSFW